MKCSLTIGIKIQHMGEKEGLGKGRPGVHRVSGKPISITHPSLIVQWNDSRFSPDSVSFGSSIPVDWKCEVCDHCWQSSPNARITKTRISGCSACNLGSLHSDGRNSLLVQYPQIALDFDLQKNSPLSPSEIVGGTAKKVWWKCHQCNYEWKASGAHRIKKGRNCKACSNKAVKSDKSNSLGAVFPDFEKDFDYSKNGDISPYDITQKSIMKVWWECSDCKHSWNARVDHRTRLGAGCPVCSGNDVHSDGRNSMKNTHPDLALEFHPTKNGKMTPENVKAGTGKKVCWICQKCKHEWNVAASSRVSKNSGCPSCAGKAVHIDGRNSLANVLPELAIEWHPTKNDNLTPASTLVGSSKGIWWVCDCCEHEWRTKVSHRTGIGSDCPACAGKAVHKDGHNSMKNTHPELTSEFHPTKNGKMTPDNLIAGTAKKVWWICNTCQKEWKTTGSTRTGGSNCPSCATGGFDQTKPAVYYCMEISGLDGVWWYKGGIAADASKRLQQIQQSLNSGNFPLEVKLVDELKFDIGTDARELETILLRIDNIRVHTVEKFEGSFELFNVNPVAYAKTNSMLKNTKNSQTKISDFS
jgi:hypothetical protein